MTEGKFDNEKEIRRFLLGEMTDGERTAFEEKFIAEDTGLFDEINVTEDELIESYIRGTLSSGEKRKFERNFLISETRRQRVAFTREMFDKLSAKKTETIAENPSVWSSIAQFFKTPRFAFGAALAILVFGLWFLVFRNSNEGSQIARQITPTPAISQTPSKIQENQNVAVDSNISSANAPETNKNSPSNTRENQNSNPPKNAIPGPLTATLALFAGTVRSGGKMRVLELTKDTRGANFQLNLENEDYQTYRAEIVDADGNVIYKSGKINARKAVINAFFPTAKLKKGDYFVKLYGFNSKGEEESAADFQFRVNQK